jgi:hypothetical protein
MAGGRRIDEGLRMELRQWRAGRPPRLSRADVPAAPVEPEPRHTAHEVRATAARLADVLDRLPPVPFTIDEFTGHALGMNALRHSDEVAPALAHFEAAGIIRRWWCSDQAMWLPVRWTNGDVRGSSLRARLDPLGR